MSELKPIKEIDVAERDENSRQKQSFLDEKSGDEERAKKAVEEIKAANEFYNQKLKSLNEKRNEVNILQVETFEALQKATAMNEQFNMVINSQLLKERGSLQDEVKKLKSMLEKANAPSQ